MSKAARVLDLAVVDLARFTVEELFTVLAVGFILRLKTGIAILNTNSDNLELSW